MSDEIEPQKLVGDLKVSLSFKEILGVGSFLIYLGVAIAGYYGLREQVAKTTEDFEQLEKDVTGIIRNLDAIQIRQDESINKLSELTNKLNDVDRKIDNIGYDIRSIGGVKRQDR